MLTNVTKGGGGMVKTMLMLTKVVKARKKLEFVQFFHQAAIFHFPYNKAHKVMKISDQECGKIQLYI